MTTLAEQISALCADHDLSSLSITYFADGPAKGFHAYAHGAPGETGASQSLGVTVTLETAIGTALSELANKRRGPVAIDTLVAA